jgi:hypothetical protein
MYIKRYIMETNKNHLYDKKCSLFGDFDNVFHYVWLGSDDGFKLHSASPDDE